MRNKWIGRCFLTWEWDPVPISPIMEQLIGYLIPASCRKAAESHLSAVTFS